MTVRAILAIYRTRFNLGRAGAEFLYTAEAPLIY
jgi:hypothetical protein